MNTLEKFLPLKAEIAEIVSPLMSIKVVDFKSSVDAIEAAKIIKEMAKRLDVLRREQTDPLNDQIKEINAYARSVGESLTEADLHVRNEINAFAVIQERERQALFKKAEEDRKNQEALLREKQAKEKEALDLFGMHDESTELVDNQHAEERAVLQAEIIQKKFDIQEQQIKNTRKTLCVAVENINEVPNEFLITELNESMAKAAYKGGKKQIPGLRFYEEISVPIGSKTRVPKSALQ